MKKEQVMELMNSLPPELVEEADVQPPARRRLPKGIRSGLVAACLCLALVGTAFAATAVYQMVVKTGQRESEGRQYSTFEVYGEPARFTLEDFSRQLQEDYTAWDRYQGGILPGGEFQNWEEAKAYLGDNIPCTWRDTGGVEKEYVYRVQSIPDLSWDTNDLQYVMFYNNAWLKSGVTSETEIYIYGEVNVSDLIYSLGESLGTDFQVLGSYAMANGCTAQIVTQATRDEEWPRPYCIGCFMKSGILYKVSIFGGGGGQVPMDELEDQLYQVLDSFY